MLLEAASLASAGALAALYFQRRHIPEDTSRANLAVVITGSTRGLGLALAKEFVRCGDSVVVSGRSTASVEAARKSLLPLVSARGQQVLGAVCDVSSASACEDLARTAHDGLGKLDMWINNAGQTQHPKTTLAETPTSVVADVISTNLLGSIFGCRAAIITMQKQHSQGGGGGTIFNIDGSGSRGNPTANSLAYGASKAALPQLAKTLARETKGSGVRVHTASPGMVTTDLLMREATPSALKIFNILAENPETTARWLVPRMRATHLSERASGEYICFLTARGVAWRFVTAPWRRNRLVKVDQA